MTHEKAAQMDLAAAEIEIHNRVVVATSCFLPFLEDAGKIRECRDLCNGLAISAVKQLRALWINADEAAAQALKPELTLPTKEHAEAANRMLAASMNRQGWHKHLGEVMITEECDYLQSTNPDPTSRFVVHDGEVKEVTKALVKVGEPWFERASGLVICEKCGKQYYDHPPYMKALSVIDQRPVLNQLCDGSLVKL